MQHGGDDGIAFVDKQFNLSTGCGGARSDANHDFKNTFKGGTVQELVNLSVPAGCPQYAPAAALNVRNEDNFVKNVMLKEGAAVGRMKIPPDGNVAGLQDEAVPGRKSLLETLLKSPNQRSGAENELVGDYFNEDLLKFYDVCAYWHPRQRTAGEAAETSVGNEEEDDSKLKDVYNDLPDAPQRRIAGSKIQNALDYMGVVGDICIVCDVAYSGLRKDLTFVKRGAEARQVFYWLQNTQTGFDPAGKTSWHTDKGYGFKDPESRFLSAWTSTAAGVRSSTLYPEWPAAADHVDRPDYASGVPPETMICSNKTMFMSTENSQGEDKWWDYKTHEARLLIRGAAGANTTYVYADKVLASKASKTFSKAALASYLASAKRFLKAFFGGTPYGEISNFTNESQVLAKKCGDMPQALSCLTPGIPFCVLKDASKPPSVDNVDCNKQTPKAMAFASFDRIAVAAAVAFCAPIVIYDQRAGGIMFVAKSLMSATARLMALEGRMDAVETFLQGDGEMHNVMTYVHAWAGDYLEKRLHLGNVCRMFGANGEGVVVKAGGFGQWMSGKWKDGGGDGQEKDETLRQFVAMLWSVLPILQQDNALKPQFEDVAVPWGGRLSGKVLHELSAAIMSFGGDVERAQVDGAEGKVAELKEILGAIQGRAAAGILLTDPDFVALLKRLAGTIFPDADAVAGGGDVPPWLATIRDATGKEVPQYKDLAEAVTNGYGKIVSILENAASTARLVQTQCQDFNQLYGNIVLPITSTPGLTLDPAGGSGARFSALIATLPKAINQNIAKLVPNTKYADIKTMRARGPLDGLDEMEQKYGAKFYKIRDTMFQIETLMRPLWEGLEALREPQPKAIFKAGMFAFFGGIVDAQAPGQPKTSLAGRIKAAFLGAGEPGLRVFAASGLEALEEMFKDPAPEEDEAAGPVPMQGGGAPPAPSLEETLGYFQNWEMHKGEIAGAHSAEVYHERVQTCAQRAIELDDFIRVFGSTVAFQYYNYVNSFSKDADGAPQLQGPLVLNDAFMKGLCENRGVATAFDPVKLVTVEGGIALGGHCDEVPGVHTQRGLWRELKDYVLPEEMYPLSELEVGNLRARGLDINGVADPTNLEHVANVVGPARAEIVHNTAAEQMAAGREEHPHYTAYLFNGLQNQLDNCECKLAHSSRYNFLQCFSEVNELMIELKADRPNPHNEEVRNKLNDMFHMDLVRNTVRPNNLDELKVLGQLCEMIMVGIPTAGGYRIPFALCLKEAMAYGMGFIAPPAHVVPVGAPAAAFVRAEDPMARETAVPDYPMSESEDETVGPGGPPIGGPAVRHTVARIASESRRRTRRNAARLRRNVKASDRDQLAEQQRAARAASREAATEALRPRQVAGGRRTRRRSRS